jgi:ElaB/YqjD/DUF883 family membrane-anchored ribosome-binding protein
MANTPNTPNKNQERSGSSGTSFGSTGSSGTSYGSTGTSHSHSGEGSRIGDTLSSTASAVADKARETVSSIGQKASDIASDVSNRAENASASVASGMRSFADTIREHSPSSGMLGSAGSSVADTLESGGRYLEQSGFSGLGTDLTNFVRRNPMPALCLGIGLGFLLAHAVRR